MLATVIFSNTYWTFWDVMLLFFVWIPLLMLWFFCIADVFRRHDIGGGAKALWLVGIVVLPWIGSLLYLIVRPWDEEQYAPANTYSGSGHGAPAPSEASGTVPTS